MGDVHHGVRVPGQDQKITPSPAEAVDDTSESQLGRAGDGAQRAQAGGPADTAIAGVYLGQILEQPPRQIPVLAVEYIQGLPGMCVQGAMNGLYTCS